MPESGKVVGQLDSENGYLYTTLGIVIAYFDSVHGYAEGLAA